MKIIIDECLPKRMTQFFKKGSAYTVPQIGLSGSTDTAQVTNQQPPVNGWLEKMPRIR